MSRMRIIFMYESAHVWALIEKHRNSQRNYITRIDPLGDKMSRPEYQLPPDVLLHGESCNACYLLWRLQTGVDCSMDSASEQQEEEEQQQSQQQQPSLLLDLGVGSGISASCLVKKGHFVVGVDISRFMLEEAVEFGSTEERADAVLADLGQRLNFRPAIFDGAISISALQWLCSGVQWSPLESPPTFADVAGERAAAAERANAINTGCGKDTTAAAGDGPRASQAAGAGTSARDPPVAGAAADVTRRDVTEGSSVDDIMEEDKEEAEEDTPRATQVHLFTSKLFAEKKRSAAAHAGGGDAKSNTPYGRLRRFFAWLYASLRPGARAALQFYPDSTEQVETITAAALRAGFNGGLVVDYPNSAKAKKHFLVLWVGGGYMSTAEQQRQLQNAAMDSSPQDHVLVARRERQKRTKQRSLKAGGLSRRQWILKKKEKHRLQGKVVRHDSKYMGRKRKDKF
eukprot:XP_028346052.1 probable 18S rRNA (guanine-N(7))-methyltransferase [Physeter catodon]